METSELTDGLLYAIQQLAQKQSPSTVSILAETYIRLANDQLNCQNEKNKPLPEPEYIAALGTLAYYVGQKH